MRVDHVDLGKVRHIVGSGTGIRSKVSRKEWKEICICPSDKEASRTNSPVLQIPVQGPTPRGNARLS